jgi:hypothetical protein
MNPGRQPALFSLFARYRIRYFVFYTTIAEKTSTSVLTTRYVPATIVLTITARPWPKLLASKAAMVIV